jgi:hypothetical protein
VQTQRHLLQTNRAGTRSLNRRDGLRRIGLAAMCGLLSTGHFGAQGTTAPQAPGRERSPEEWMNEWMTAKVPVGTLHVSRFREPIYFLIKPITWRPNPGQEKYAAVTVPVGFVTEFASIPRPFWSLLRPDGDYTYPAIVHDYLYWTQTRSKEVADSIFRFGMQDFGVNPATVAAIYEAVHLGGGSAWSSNAQLKRRGEQRILKRSPDNPRTSWQEWKKRPDVF